MGLINPSFRSSSTKGVNIIPGTRSIIISNLLIDSVKLEKIATSDNCCSALGSYCWATAPLAGQILNDITGEKNRNITGMNEVHAKTESLQSSNSENTLWFVKIRSYEECSEMKVSHFAVTNRPQAHNAKVLFFLLWDVSRYIFSMSRKSCSATAGKIDGISLEDPPEVIEFVDQWDKSEYYNFRLKERLHTAPKYNMGFIFPQIWLPLTC